MEILKSSWHTKLYAMVFGWDNLPDSLCKYFWKLILAIILFIPLAVVHLFGLPAYYLLDKYEDEHYMEDLHDEGMFSHLFFFSILCALVMAMVTCMIVMWFIPNESIVHLGVIGFLIVGAICTLHLIDRMKTHRIKDTLVWKYTKARLGKYCPKITWKETK